MFLERTQGDNALKLINFSCGETFLTRRRPRGWEVRGSIDAEAALGWVHTLGKSFSLKLRDRLPKKPEDWPVGLAIVVASSDMLQPKVWAIRKSDENSYDLLHRVWTPDEIKEWKDGYIKFLREAELAWAAGL